MRDAIASSRFLPSRHLDSDRARLISLAVAEVEETLAQGGTRLEAGDGFAVIAELPWESRVLARRMAVLKHVFFGETPAMANQLVERAARWASESGFDFLLCKVYTDRHALIHALTGQGFLLVETMLQHVWESRRDLGPADDPRVREARDSDREAVLRVCQAAFELHVGRFHSDPRISHGDAARVYEEWIRSAFDGYADAIYVAEQDGGIAGYSIWKAAAAAELAAGIRAAHYSIGAVDPAFQRQGLFRALTLAGMRRYHGSADVIDGPTHLRNLAVQRAYRSHGWELRDSQYTFHRWLA
jgi:ribosomal protein S18 acetylase RimI-like enzyme